MKSLTRQSARALHWNFAHTKDYPQAFACIVLSSIASVSLIVFSVGSLL